MFKYCRILIAGMVLLVVSGDAMAFWDPPYITPASPVAGQEVSINIRGGICDALFYAPGYPQITQNGSQISIIQKGQHWEPSELCTYEVGVATFGIGTYSAGQYTVSMYMRYRDFLGNIRDLHLGDAEFTVAASAAPPAPVPSMGAIGMWVLLLLTGVAALRQGRLRGTLLFCAVAFFSGLVSTSAKANGVIAVLVSGASGAPTPSAVVSYANASRRAATPPLQAFRTVAPQSGTFLIPDRASGDFLAWLNSNPNSPRKKLEDYVLLTYATADIGAALSSLVSDPYVVAAYEPLPAALSSVGLEDFASWRMVPASSPWALNTVGSISPSTKPGRWRMAMLSSESSTWAFTQTIPPCDNSRRVQVRMRAATSCPRCRGT